MDRFKFRAFYKPTKRMKIIIGVDDNFAYGLPVVNGMSPMPIGLDGCVLMQCTGLKDKNGKLIYEGDILKDPNWVKQSEYEPKELIFKIEYHDPSYRLMVYVTGMDEYDEIDQILNQIDECPLEVVGNIYENPELLKVD